MRIADVFDFTWQVLRGNRARSLLMLLAMSIGVAAVVTVSALGEGARLYVVNQFGALGTNLVIVLPGRSETAGAAPGIVLGATTRDVTLDDALALKRSPAVLRIGDRRFRVIGLLAGQGESLGFNTDEMVIVPLSAAQALFDTDALFRVLIEARSREQIPHAKADAEEIIRQRHEGKRDVTVITQDAVLATFDRILRALTLAVGGIAAISLAVAGILIMNVMLIAVTQRRQEIGLLKALGATAGHIRLLFLTEAALLALGGAATGLAVGQAGCSLATRIYPAIPFTAPWWALLAAPATAVVTAVVFTVVPARRAASLDPVQALSRR